MIDLPPGITLGSGKKIPYHSLLPNVEFKNVVFSYPSRLNQVSFFKKKIFILASVRLGIS